MKFMTHKSVKKGFSLIELMVVISIAAILIALGTVSYTTAQKKGRDAKRRGDLKAVSNAFEQYQSEFGYYDADGIDNGCADIDVSEQMPAGLPQDPKPSNDPYEYFCEADTFCVCATLEAPGTGNASVNDDTCSTLGTAGDYFCVKNLQ